MRRIRNILIVLLAAAILCGCAVLPRIVAEIQDGALLNVLSYGQMNPVKLELSQEEAQTGSGLNIMEKLAIYRNGNSFYPGEDYPTVHTKEEILAFAEKALSTYRDAGLIREDMEANMMDEYQPVMMFHSSAPGKLFAIWYVTMWNYDCGSFLGMAIDDETGQVLLMDYASGETEMEWDYSKMCGELYSLYMKAMDNSVLQTIEPTTEDTEEGYVYNYTAMYVAWGDANFGEVVLEFTVSIAGFYVCFS